MNTKDILLNKIPQTGWSIQSCLTIVCNFIDELCSMSADLDFEITPDEIEELFKEYINGREFQETKIYKEYLKNMFGEDIDDPERTGLP